MKIKTKIEAIQGQAIELSARLKNNGMWGNCKITKVVCNSCAKTVCRQYFMLLNDIIYPISPIHTDDKDILVDNGTLIVKAMLNFGLISKKDFDDFREETRQKKEGRIRRNNAIWAIEHCVKLGVKPPKKLEEIAYSVKEK